MSAFMNYIPTPQGGGVPGQGADKYHGAVAQGYNAKREHDPKWFLEQKIIEDMLDDLPAGDWVLDVPCGTGRFFKFYDKKGLVFRGVDKSIDMLMEAAVAFMGAEPSAEGRDLVVRGFARGDPVRLGEKCILRHGDVRELKLAPKSVDAAVCCRLTRWLSPEDCGVMMRELQRITRKRIIITARVANHPHARTLDLFENALADGWRLTRNEVGVDMDYRVLMFEQAPNAR